MTEEHPEAQRLRLAAEQHMAMCKKFGPEGFHFDPSPQDVLAILDRLHQVEAERDAAKSALSGLSKRKDDWKWRALEAEAQLAVQPGWKLVPLEPTQEMLDAYVKQVGRFHSGRSDWAAMLAASPTPPAWNIELAHGIGSPSIQHCWCTTCRPITLSDMRFVVCPECGNKRCPRAHNHELACTGSNAPGQPGSSWEHVKPATGAMNGN